MDKVQELRRLLERYCDDSQRDVMQCMEIRAIDERNIILWLNNFRFAIAKAMQEIEQGAGRMTVAWDRDEALRAAERLGALYHAHDPNSPNAFLLDDAAALLRAADAEIARLQTQVEAAEKTAEALRGVSVAAWDAI